MNIIDVGDLGERLENKIALVSEAGSGLGREIAELHAREGAKIVIADMNMDGDEETVQTINAAGGKALAEKTNVTDEEDGSA